MSRKHRRSLERMGLFKVGDWVIIVSKEKRHQEIAGTLGAIREVHDEFHRPYAVVFCDIDGEQCWLLEYRFLRPYRRPGTNGG